MLVVWKSIDGFPHEVSNCGDVRNWKGRLLKKGIAKYNGRRSQYYRVNIVDNNGVLRYLLVHRLVATYFCDKKDGDKVVCHIDNNGLNNHYTNLYWGTQSDNVKQAYNDGLISDRSGSNNPNYKGNV